LNVLLITIDQWRADSLGCGGHPVALTPNIDRLAARGVRFVRHYAQAAPCGPSRASLLTGMYQHRHRVVGNGTPLDARFTNLALEMAAAGYRPTLFGYTDTTVDPSVVERPDDPRLRTYEGVLPGFEVEVQLPEAADRWIEWLVTKGYDRPASVWDLYGDRDTTDAAGRGASWAPVRYSSDHTEAAFLVERFVEWHRAQPSDTPWFAHLTFLRPHPPYVAPAPFHDLIDPDDVPMPVRHADRRECGVLSGEKLPKLRELRIQQTCGAPLTCTADTQKPLLADIRTTAECQVDVGTRGDGFGSLGQGTGRNQNGGLQSR